MLRLGWQLAVVYGELGRRGIYDFHDMYRLLGERRNPALARKLVAALPDTSWLKKNKNMLTGDFEKFGDSGVTDLLVSAALIELTTVVEVIGQACPGRIGGDGVAPHVRLFLRVRIAASSLRPCFPSSRGAALVGQCRFATSGVRLCFHFKNIFVSAVTHSVLQVL